MSDITLRAATHADIPTLLRSLKVGAMFENGYMTGLYELDGEKMAEVKE